jgi:hypothetical protein
MLPDLPDPSWMAVLPGLPDSLVILFALVDQSVLSEVDQSVLSDQYLLPALVIVLALLGLAD